MDERLLADLKRLPEFKLTANNIAECRNYLISWYLDKYSGYYIVRFRYKNPNNSWSSSLTFETGLQYKPNTYRNDLAKCLSWMNKVVDSELFIDYTKEIETPFFGVLNE
jgi:hypothetical protein